MKMIDVTNLTDDEIELCKMLIEKNKADCIGRSCSNCFLGYIDGNCIDLAKKILIEIEKNKSLEPQHVEYPDVKDYNPISVNNNCISTEQYNCYDRTINHDQDKCKNIAKKILNEIEINKSEVISELEIICREAKAGLASDDLAESIKSCIDMIKVTNKEYNRTIKHDQDKPRWDLLPYKALEQIAIIMTQGAKKYGEYNWQKVEKERYQAAMMRHFCEYMNGNLLDKDSGMMHISHVLVNALFLVWKELENESNSDRNL